MDKCVTFRGMGLEVVSDRKPSVWRCGRDDKGGVDVVECYGSSVPGRLGWSGPALVGQGERPSIRGWDE